jgi:hypothetical protein
VLSTGGKMGMDLGSNPLYVKKNELLVHLQLTNGLLIKGSIHLANRVRLTDTLNFQTRDKPFLPVTNAQITNQSGETIMVPFIIINRMNILTCIPQKPVEN